MQDAYSKEVKEVFDELDSSKKGLTNQQAQTRLKKFGENKIKKDHKLRPLKILLDQFKSFLIYILIIAIIISAFLGELFDAIVITIIVLVNAGIGFFQQYKAERAVESLKKLLVPTSTVIRNGKYTEVPSEQLVPGDIVVFEAGDKVNADCRVIESDNLQANEAILTGESMPIDKRTSLLKSNTVLAERLNMLYTGTQIVRGSGKGIVVATAMNTEFGKIAFQLQEINHQKTPMQKRLDKFSKQLGLIILFIVIGVMLLGVLEQFDKIEMFMVALALAVGSIPEGLPAVLAISFAIASMFMSKRNVIIRKLPAVESLGSVTVICSDKTGTLTQEQMEIQEIFSNNKLYQKKDKEILFNDKQVNVSKNKELFKLIKTSVLASNARFEKTSGEYKYIGDPTEEALVKNALELEISRKDLTEQEPRLKEFEFDSSRKMMSILRDTGRNSTLYSKGAPEKIISKCSFELVSGQVKRLNEKRKKEILEQSKSMESKALRVLGFAYKNFNKNSSAQESSLIFLGLVGMIDPPRKEIKDSIKKCNEAGIGVKIITGDSLLTAIAISKQIGIKGKAITGEQLDSMNDYELEEHINEISIFARTTPKQKLRIVEMLQKNQETVAVTGDGVNDVLALKSANIGIAMGIRGTDVSRETADVVLTDDNFASIVAGVEEGRKTYDNIKKFTKYMLSVNFSHIILITISLFLGMPLPLLPLQILWINLITDSFPALTLVFEKDENVMKSKPRREESLLQGIWKFILIAGLITFFAELFVFLIALNKNISISYAQTMVLTTSVLFELFFIYTCRSKKPLTEIGIFSNKWLNMAFLFGLALQLILIYTPLAGIFKLTALSLNDWLLVIPFALSGLILFEITKYIRK